MSAEACPWCGAALPAAAPPHHVERCPSCGVGVTRPAPTVEELDRAYAAYRPESGRFPGPADALLRRSRATLAGRIDALAPPGPVLDVGAGDGTLVRALEARGREAIGTERDEEPDIRGPFAAVVFWHSLEHLPDAGDALRTAAQRLVPGGLLVVAVPNLESLQARAFGARWLALDLPRHLVHLPARALTARLEELGLRVERRSSWRGGQVVFGWLHGLVGAFPGRPDLYDALRRREARMQHQPAGKRFAAVALGLVCAPVAALCAAVEIALGRGGSIEVEARRHP